MTRRDRERRLARLDELGRTHSRTPAQEAEHDRLIGWRDGLWKRLPMSISRARQRVAELEGFADKLGLGPC